MTLSDIFEAFHITPQFPPAAKRQLSSFGSSVEKEDLKGRLDLTSKVIFTIDGDDAKDFDDAVSLEKNEKGNFVLGVHIADVSHYVTENSPVDRAAFQRGTSVYLINTVVPMLPFELSNELCSLKPDVIRLTLSVFMEITPGGVLKSYEIFESYIKSSYRLTYNEVSQVLEKNKELLEKYKDIVKILSDMNTLAKALRKRRMLRGAIDFKTRESKITLDLKDFPISVEKYEIKDSNSLIEEFMLITNETVAKHFVKNNLPGIFRIHDEPSGKKVEQLNKVLSFLGIDYTLKFNSESKEYQQILNSIKGKSYESVVNYLMLRSMSKAEYFEQNKGHFGLSAKYYCHFTSPIRRYPDLLTHRILKKFIHKKMNEEERLKYQTICQSAAITSTATEINAADAEIEYKKFKTIQYMEDKIDEKYEGNISHITPNGFFVELDNTAEGFVLAKDIQGDVFVISENMLSLEGITTRKKYTVGDRVKIKVIYADAEDLILDFEVIEKKTGARKKKILSKSASKAIREIKKESKKIRIEKEEKRFVIDYAISVAYQKACDNILKPFIDNIGALKSEKRYIRTSFDDFWHIAITPVIRQYYKSEEQGFEGERFFASFEILFENFVYSVCDSLSKNADKKFVEAKRNVLRKILSSMFKEINKR